MKAYYEHAGITIYHGDCRGILPLINEIIDLIVTDPPYGMSFRSNHREERHEKIANDHRLPIELVRLCIQRASRAAYMFCRWDNLREMPNPTSVIAWIKNNWSMGDLNHEHGRQWEAICFYPGPSHQFVKRIPDVIMADRTGNNLHPTEKPVDLLKTLLSCNVGDLVCDPFAGSGSTLLAAKECGKLAIGIEIEEKYCEVAAKRLSQEVFSWQ